MPQDIQTKDGIILRGIPDGTPDDVIKARIEQIRGGKSSPKFTGDADPAATEAQAISGATPAQLIAGSAPARFAMGAASPLMGLLQLGAHTSGALLDKGAGAIGLEKPNLAGKMDELVQNAERLKKEGMAAYGDKGFDAIGLGGAVMNPVGLTVGKALPAAATLLGKVGQGAGIGAAGGASSPVMDSGDFAEKKAIQTGAGAAVGGAVPLVVAAGKVPLKAAYNLAEPFLPGGAERIAGRMANTAAGDRRQEIVDALTQNRQLVPGSQGTAGEVAAPAGSAEFSALQRVAGDKLPSDYDAIRRAQDAARVAELQTVGGDKAALAQAVADRSANAATNYGTAYSQAIKADPALLAMSKNPYFKSALPDAVKLAEANGVDPKTNLTQFLHYVKLSLDKDLAKSGDTALSSTEKAAVQELQKNLVGWMGAKNPAYETARSAFAAQSKPINQMEIGQYLEKKLVPALADSGAAPSQRSAVFSQAVRDAPGTIKRAIGGNRFDSLDQVLTPPQVQSVGNVGADLARKADYENLAKQGMPAVQDQLGKQVEGIKGLNLLDRTATIVRAIVNRMEGKGGEKAIGELSLIMQDPQKMAKVMENALPSERAKIVDAMMQRQMSNAGAVAATRQ